MSSLYKSWNWYFTEPERSCPPTAVPQSLRVIIWTLTDRNGKNKNKQTKRRYTHKYLPEGEKQNPKNPCNNILCAVLYCKIRVTDSQKYQDTQHTLGVSCRTERQKSNYYWWWWCCSILPKCYCPLTGGRFGLDVGNKPSPWQGGWNQRILKALPTPKCQTFLGLNHSNLTSSNQIRYCTITWLPGQRQSHFHHL